MPMRTRTKSARAEVLHDRAKAVVARVPAAELQAHVAERQIELVVQHDDVARGDLEERHRRLHARAPTRS